MTNNDKKSNIVHKIRTVGVVIGLTVITMILVAFFGLLGAAAGVILARIVFHKE